MATLLKNAEQVAGDPWIELPEGQTASEFSIVSLDYWIEHKEALSNLAGTGKLGLALGSEETANKIADDCHQFGLITIQFPKFTDGRGYSAARLLRERYGFKHDLRACGDVLVDQLFFMQRVGFTTFALRNDQDIDDALASFSTFTSPYQGDVNDPRPLFRRQADQG